MRALLLFCLGLFSFAPAVALAQASLFITPNTGTYKTGDLFSVVINVNTGGQAINAASGQLNFDNTRLEVRSIGYSHSVFNLWTAEPSFSNSAGSVAFSGGLPNPGFTGASGAILRVTFRAKESGQAPLTFISGSVLANDGAGTNILDTLKGGLFTVLSGAPRVKVPKVAPAASAVSAPVETSAQTLEPPILTDYPRELQSGEPLVVKGIGLPLSKVLVAVQKGTNEPGRSELWSGPDGRFTFTWGGQVESGFYRIWARNIGTDGTASAPSDAVIVEVSAPAFLRVGAVAINYLSIAITLLALVVLLLLTLFYIWRRVRSLQVERGIEITEAERAVHQGFDTLKDGLARYLRYLVGGKDSAAVKRREDRTQKELREELDTIEHVIEKEIRDIKKKN